MNKTDAVTGIGFVLYQIFSYKLLINLRSVVRNTCNLLAGKESSRGKGEIYCGYE